MSRFLAFLSWIPLIGLPALGLSLGGLWGGFAGFFLGVAIFVYANDWEVRAARDRDARAYDEWD